MCVCIFIPLFSVEESKDVLAGHETLLHVTQLQVVHLQHVFLLLLLQRATEKRIFERCERDDLMAGFILSEMRHCESKQKKRQNSIRVSTRLCVSFSIILH